MALHKPLYMVVVIGTVVMFFITMVITVWAMSVYDIFEEWFNRQGDQFGKGPYFDIRFGPPAWLIDMMWPLIYIYQIIWLCYGLFTLCRRTPDGTGYLYYKPSYMPVSMYSSFLMSQLFRLTWAALLPRCGPVCVGMLTGSALTSALALAISFMALYKNGAALYRMGLSTDVLLVRVLVHNGLAFYATWEFGDMFVSLSGVMTADGYTQKDAFTTMISISALLLIAYAVADLLFIDKVSRYTVTPYIMYILSYIGIVERHWYTERVSLLSMTFLMLAIFGLAFKVVLIIFRGRIDPEPIPTDATSWAPVLQNDTEYDQSYRNVMMRPVQQPSRVWMPNYNITQMTYM